MKLTQRGKYAVVILYTIVMTALVFYIFGKDEKCVDPYVADILATQFLYGENEDVENAMNAIYNSGGWIEIKETDEPEIIFPCVLDNFIES